MTSPQAQTQAPPMPITTTGLCTKDVEDPGSETFSPGKLTKSDRKFFKGHVSECRDWQTTEEQLQSIRCNWRVEPEHLYSRKFDRHYPEVVNWYTSEGDRLGQFSNCRHIIHPDDALNWYKKFIQESNEVAEAHSELEPMSLDVIGFLPDQKVLYFVSKLTDINPERLIKVGDTTDFYLTFTINYMEARAMKAMIWANELVCTNGMTRQINDGRAVINHRKERHDYDVIHALKAAFKESRFYMETKEQLINTPCDVTEGKKLIRQYFQDSIPEETREYAVDNPNTPVDSRIVNQLERIYMDDLRGGELETRQDNLFRVHSTVTQWTSHHKAVRNGDDSRFAKQLDGNLARINTQFTDFLLSHNGAF